MGAFIGAIYASGYKGQSIEFIFKRLNVMDMISLADFSWLNAGNGLIKGEQVVKLLTKLTQNKNFENLDIPLKVIATDFWNRREVVFDHGSVMEAVRASISLPGIFEPVVKDRQILIDGGIANSLPYEIIRDQCDVLVAINVIGEISSGDKKFPTPNIFEALMSAFNIMEASNVEYKISLSKPDIYIKPKLHNIGILDFNRIDNILDSVAEDAAQFKTQLQTLFRFAPDEKKA